MFNRLDEGSGVTSLAKGFGIARGADQQMVQAEAAIGAIARVSGDVDRVAAVRRLVEETKAAA